MKFVLSLLLLLLVGCGQPMEITYHHNTSKEELVEMSGLENVWGWTWAKWKYDVEDPFEGHATGHWECDIWLISRDRVPSEDCWNKLIEHEIRHCYDGSYHDSNYRLQCQY